MKIDKMSEENKKKTAVKAVDNSKKAPKKRIKKTVEVSKVDDVVDTNPIVEEKD